MSRELPHQALEALDDVIVKATMQSGLPRPGRVFAVFAERDGFIVQMLPYPVDWQKGTSGRYAVVERMDDVPRSILGMIYPPNLTSEFVVLDEPSEPPVSWGMNLAWRRFVWLPDPIRLTRSDDACSSYNLL